MLRSSTTISEVIFMSELMEPVSPGELLREEFLEPMGLSQYRLAKETDGRSRPAHRADRAGQASHHCRYRSAVMPVLRPERWLLVARPSSL